MRGMQTTLSTSAHGAAFMAAALVLTAGCLEPPNVGKAADPKTAESAAPIMGGATNAELQKKVAILEDFLDGKLTAEQVQKRLTKDFGNLDDETRTQRLKALQEALEGLGDGVGKGNPMPKGAKRDLIFARYYFTERRFIEAGELLSGILDQNPDHPEARILLARCFYFLGNPDRTLQELELRLQQLEKKRMGNPEGWNDRDAYEYVDALFLIGAAVLESPGTSRDNLEKGKRAWETYLQMAPNSTAVEKVKEGLAEIEAGLRGEGRLAQAQVAKAAAAMGSGQGVKGGAASFGGGGMGPEAKQADRVKNLPADASPFDRAVATMLDALDARDAATALEAIAAAEKIQPNAPVVMTSKARAMVVTGSIPEGLQLYGQIIKRHPDYVPAWHYMGMAHLMSGDPGQAASSWEQVQKLDAKYFADNNLARRVQVAKKMAQGR